MRILNSIIIIFLLLSVAGCKKPSLQKKGIEQKPISTPQSQAQSPVMEERATEVFSQVYRYEPFDKTDPFEPIISEEGKEEGGAIKTPLEDFNVNQFKLIGIIWGIAEPKAIVSDPKSNTYIIGLGTKIGRNNGKVIRILEKKLVVLEEYEDIFGNVKTGEVILEIKE